jgi:hypothetical protein
METKIAMETKIVNKIYLDLAGRKGLSHGWDSICFDIQEEIFNKWVDIIRNENLENGKDGRLTGKAMRIVNGIVSDLSDRCGLGDAWGEIDDDIQMEIAKEWIEIVVETAQCHKLPQIKSQITYKENLDKYFKLKDEYNNHYETLKDYIHMNLIRELERYDNEYWKNIGRFVHGNSGVLTLIKNGMDIIELEDKYDSIDIILKGEDRDGDSYGDTIRIKKEDIGDLKSVAKKMYDEFLAKVEKASEEKKAADRSYKKYQQEQLKKELGEA